MAIALLPFAGLVEPLFSRWATRLRRIGAAPRGGPKRARPGSILARDPGVTPCLRVMRLFEDGSAAERGARLIISGRMADVCAELERLAAFEEGHPPR